MTDKEKALHHIRENLSKVERGISWKSTRDYRQARFMALSEIKWILEGKGDPLVVCEKHDMYVCCCLCNSQTDVFKFGSIRM